MAVIHISEAEAARDLQSVLAKVRAGEEVCIDGTDDVIELAAKPRSRKQPFDLASTQPRSISEIIEAMKANPSSAKLDGGYAEHLESVIREGQQERWNDWESS